MKEKNFLVDKNNPEVSFNRIAKKLFSEYCITTNNGNYFITEIEFYFKSPEHDDKFVHGHESQKTNGFWYFHWAGIDITIGDGENTGGVLIRGVKKKNQLDNWVYTSGPIKVMQEMLSFQNSVFSENSLKLQLIEFSLEMPIEIFRSKRIGLHTNSIPTIYHDKLYRYVIDNSFSHPFKQKGTIEKV